MNISEIQTYSFAPKCTPYSVMFSHDGCKPAIGAGTYYGGGIVRVIDDSKNQEVGLSLSKSFSVLITPLLLGH